MVHQLHHHRAFFVLLLIFVVAVAVHQNSLPAIEGSDEPLHFNYVEFLRAENRLPDRRTYLTNSTQQASGQPPLAYWLAGLPLRLVNLPPLDGDAVFDQLDRVKNAWTSPHNLWDRANNKNIYLHGPGEVAFDSTIAHYNRLMRLVSGLLGAVGVIGAYGAASELFRHTSWRLVATALFAFMPTYLFICSYVTNDIAATVFSTLAVWQTLRLMRLGASPLRLMLVGLLIALGALSKINALLIGPGAGLAILLVWRRQRAPFIHLARDGILFALPLAVFFGAWVLYGLVNYGDPLGVNTHRLPDKGITFFYESPRSLLDILPQTPAQFRSYWGLFNLVTLLPATYAVLYGIPGLALLGALRWFGVRRAFRFWRSQPSQQAAVLIVMLLFELAGLVRWIQQLDFAGARLMYPAHVVVAMGFTAGLWALATCAPRWRLSVQLYVAGVVMAAGLVFAPVALYNAYGPPPMLTRDQLPALQGQPLDFDQSIRFLGYTQPDDRLTGPIHRITLCWEVQRTPTRPAAFSIKFVHDGVIVADRTTVHGLGRYPAQAWQPGAIFCDDTDLFMDDPDVPDDPMPQPAQTYDMLLVMLDAETKAVDWKTTTPEGQAVEYPIIGQIVSPAGDMRTMVTAPLTPSDIVFPGFARLEGYASDADPTPGQVVNLTLLWNVEQQTPDNWTQFIHLVGDGETVVLADGLPRGGNYPTWAWSSGEQVADTWTLTLPADLSPGEHALHIGFYRQDTGQRMPVTQEGTAPPDNSAVLLTFTVD